jgi:uncharacterized lipoprotein YddW (UPF0748 family)
MLLPFAALLAADPPLPPLPREFRAAWVATVDNIDWPDHRGESTAREARELTAIMDRAKTLHLNAIILQIRPSADALYPSRLEPWSEYLTGAQGKAPVPPWDPLAIAIREAHERGIQLHAWFNPFRAESPAQKGPNDPTHISQTHPEVVKSYDHQLWMDPGEELVRHRSLDVILDVVRRYDIDGVHIDDYFYPYKDAAKSDFPDDASWGRYHGSLSRADWRRRNVDEFVEQLYKRIKTAKPWVLFGISPFGIYRPGFPSGIHAGVDQYADLFADARKWLREGWCDYFTPQLYWPIAQKPQAFGTLLNWWVSENARGRHIWPGDYSGKVDPSLSTWQPKEIVDEIDLTEATHGSFATNFDAGKPSTPTESGATGNVHFSMREFMRDGRGLNEQLLAGPYRTAALPPPSPWLARGAGPTLRHVGHQFVTSAEFVAWSSLRDGAWTPWQVGDVVEASRATGEVAAVAVDRYGRVSRVVRS